MSYFLLPSHRVGLECPTSHWWTKNTLLPIALHIVDQEYFTYHCFTQDGLGISYFPLIYTE